MQRTGYLGHAPEGEELQGPPCELLLTAEDLGSMATAGILPLGGAGWLVVLLTHLHPQFPRMITVAFNSREEALMRDLVIDEDAPLRPFVPQPQPPYINVLDLMRDSQGTPAPPLPVPLEDETERLFHPFHTRGASSILGSRD